MQPTDPGRARPGDAAGRRSPASAAGIAERVLGLGSARAGRELPIAEPELLERLAMDDREFAEYVRRLAAGCRHATYEPRPWPGRSGTPGSGPAGSYRLTAAGAELLERMSPAERDEAIAEYAAGAEERLPLLAIGSNCAPDVLRRKFAHFPEPTDRSVLALTGRLNEFDVGFAAQPALYGSMPATLFPSPGTAVGATLLWVTPAQFTQLAWSELSYRLGQASDPLRGRRGRRRIRRGARLRFALRRLPRRRRARRAAAVPAEDRSARALTRRGCSTPPPRWRSARGARAETLVRAVFEDFAGLVPSLVETVRRESLPFASERWTPFADQP